MGRAWGRALLSAGIAALHARGAQSVTLGVDSGAAAPLTLYRSAGFTEIDRLELWEAQAGRQIAGVEHLRHQSDAVGLQAA